MRIVLNDQMYKLGLENAELAKKIKDLEAHQTLAQGLMAFLQGGVALYQLAHIPEIKNQLIKDSSLGPQIEQQQKKIEALRTSVPAGDAESKALRDAQIKSEKEILADLRHKGEKEILQQFDFKNQELQLRAKVLESFSNGIINLVIALDKQSQGSIEKQKALNEALIQSFVKLEESLSKNKDELYSLFSESMKTSAETAGAHTRMHRAGAG